MAFDISTVTFKGSELFAAATAADKLIVSGCDAFVAAYTLEQAQAITARVSSPMTTSSDVTLVGSGDNHIMLRAIFEAGITSGGLAKTLMIFGHKQSDPDNDFVLCVVSSNDGFNLPLTTDAISTFETLFDVEYVVPGDSVATATTAVFATLAEFNDLKSRAVLCHNYGDSTHGPDQNVYGSKRFMDSAYFYDPTYIRKKDRSGVTTTESAWVTNSLSGFNNNIFEYEWKLWGDNGDYATVFVKSRGNNVSSNHDDSGEFVFRGSNVSFECPINLSSSILFESNDNGIWPVISYDSTSSDGALRFINVNNGWRSNELIIADGDNGVPYIELNTSDIRFTKHSSCDIPDSDLKFSIGPFNTETFGDIRLYNRDATARRAYGCQSMSNSFNGRYVRYFMELNDAETNENYGYVSIQHLDTHEKAFVYISGETVYARCNTVLPSDIDGVDTNIGSSSSPFKWAYIERISSTAVIAESLEPDEIQNELGLSIKWGESHNAFIKMEQIDSEKDKITISANKIYLTEETGTTGSSVSINPTLYIGVLNSSGSATFHNYVNFENEVRFNSGNGVKIRGSLVPADDISFSLGTSSRRWAQANIQAITCDIIRSDEVWGCLQYSGNGTSSNILLKKGTIGLFFISNSVFSTLGITTAVPGRAISFSNAGNNKISFATNDGSGFKKSSGTIYAGTVYIRLLSEVVVNQNETDSLALCMVTADQG